MNSECKDLTVIPKGIETEDQQIREFIEQNIRDNNIALISQGTITKTRLDRLNKAIDILEVNVTKPEFIAGLNDAQQIALLRLLAGETEILVNRSSRLSVMISEQEQKNVLNSFIEALREGVTNEEKEIQDTPDTKMTKANTTIVLGKLKEKLGILK